MSSRMAKASRWGVLACLAASSYASLAIASEVVEKRGRMEINWSAQRLRYYGESQMAAAQEPSYKDAEIRARREGRGYLATAWQDAKSLADGGVNVTDQSWPAVAKGLGDVSWSVNTDYFADGKVRVYLEAPIAKTLPTTPSSHASANSQKPEATGVIINLANADKPMAVYRIELDDGSAVFTPEDVVASSFQDRSMGYWFKKAKDRELTSVVGSKPVVLEGRRVSEGVVRVSRQAWEAVYPANQKLFADAKIVLNLP